MSGWRSSSGLELDAVADWDGDTRDDIHKAIEQFRRLLQLAGDKARCQR